MYSDLFDHLGSGGGRAGRGANAVTARAPLAGPAPLVSLKAGKMILQEMENGNYNCQPDTKRGEIRLVYKDSVLQWQWYDRRDKQVAETHMLLPGTSAGTLERVKLPPGKKHSQDRIYVWTRPINSDSKECRYDMYWMQDESDLQEPEIIAQINQYLADPALAKPPAEGATTTSSSLGTTTTQTSSANPATADSRPLNQVDALSTILENLGMPQSSSSSSVGDNDNATDLRNNATTGGGTLTLADLQGAIAGMQQQQQLHPQPSIIPLTEVVTPAAISSLLEIRDEAARQRLLELLPENQRTPEFLEDNLRSPQVQQTLRQLTQALLPDDDGNMDDVYSVLANFQLDTSNMAVLTNPIQAFLDAIIATVANEDNNNNNTGEDTTQEEDTMDEDQQDG